MLSSILLILSLSAATYTPEEQAALNELATLYQKLDELSAKAPLFINKIVLLKEPAEGRGIYQEIRGPIHSDELYLYAQIQNHTIKPDNHGQFEINLVSDIAILDPAGEVLVQDRGFGRSHFFAKTKHRETYINIAVRAFGIPNGKYRLKLTITDILSGKKAAAEIPFTVQRN